MLRPVRGSATDGGRGASSPGEKPRNTLSLAPSDFCIERSRSRVASFFETTIGGSEVVSEPTAMPHSISPLAILAPMPIAACSEVPQAWIMVMPGVVGASLVPITASRARFQSREWVTTAPPTTSSMCWPASLYLSTSPLSAVVIISRFDRSA